MRWLAAGFIGLVALGGGYFGVQQRFGVESEIREGVAEILATNPEFARVTLAADEERHDGVWGRAVYLEGRVSNGAELAALKSAVGDAGGVRKVIVDGVQEIAYIPAPADYTFSASKSDDDVAVTGLAEDFETQQALIALSGAALNAREDQLNITLADPMPADWVNSVSAGLAQLQGLELGSLHITGEQAVLSGTATTADAYRAAQQFPAVMNAESSVPGRIGSLNLALDRYTFDARKGETAIFLSGGMPDQATLSQVEAYAGQAFPGYDINSDMLVSAGVPTSSWDMDAQASIDALKSYNTGRAYMGMGGVAMFGDLADGAAQGQTFEEVAGRLAPTTRLLTSGTNGVFFTDLDRARLDLFTTYGDGQTETLNGFVLGKPTFELTAAECIEQQQQLTSAYPIAFDLNATSPNDAGMLTLDALAGIQRACADALKGYEVTAKGYRRIDENGVEGLSAARAEAVVAALNARGVDTSALMSQGRGLAQPDRAVASGPFVELGFFDRATADAETAARLAEEARLAAEAEAEAARLAAEAEAARLVIEARRASVAQALGDVSGYEEVNGFQLPVLAFTPDTAVCAARFTDFLSKGKILFASGSADLAQESLQVIDGVAGIANVCEAALADAEIEIAGHTDSQGNDASNQALSEARAKAVLVAVQARGINTANYRAVGYGEAVPAADNSTAAGREANRRIEFTVTPPEPVVVEAAPLIVIEETLEETAEETAPTATDADQETAVEAPADTISE